jgi:hypothetical protein
MPLRTWIISVEDLLGWQRYVWYAHRECGCSVASNYAAIALGYWVLQGTTHCCLCKRKRRCFRELKKIHEQILARESWKKFTNRFLQRF